MRVEIDTLHTLHSAISNLNKKSEVIMGFFDKIKQGLKKTTESVTHH